MAVVSRDKAKAIAETALKSDSRFEGVSGVYAWDEITSRKPTPYQVAVDLQNCWIAYARWRDIRRLEASTIVAVDMTTGRITYQGCASDEG